MFSFKYLDKSKKNEYLPLLFDIMHSNMNDIAPSGLLYECEKAEFLREVTPALDKDPRQILLCYHKDELVGFVMYYTRANMIMIEELQLIKKYQRTRLFYLLCKHMMSILPNSISFIESYVDKRNVNSLSLQNWLGLEVIEGTNEKLLHLKGETNKIRNKIK